MSLASFIKQENAMRELFKQEPLVRPTTLAQCKPLFSILAGRLSPENLTCDGELPRSEVNRRARVLYGAWNALEKIVGREVDEGEVWEWERAEYEAKMNAVPEIPADELRALGVRTDDVAEGKRPTKKASTKKARALELYSRLVKTDASRKEIIAQFKEQLEMSQAGATTYYYTVKGEYDAS